MRSTEVVNREIARMLCEHPPRVPVTSGYLAIETEHELEEGMFTRIREYVPPAALDAYEARDRMRSPDEFV